MTARQHPLLLARWLTLRAAGPLWWAAEQGGDKSLADTEKLLAKKGPQGDPNDTLNEDDFLGRPLARAAKMGEGFIAEALLKAGADANHKSYAYHTTALHEAAREADPKMVRLLVSHGADPQIKNSNRSGAYDVAGNLETWVACFRQDHSVTPATFRGIEAMCRDDDVSMDARQETFLSFMAELSLPGETYAAYHAAWLEECIVKKSKGKVNSVEEWVFGFEKKRGKWVDPLEAVHSWDWMSPKQGLIKVKDHPSIDYAYTIYEKMKKVGYQVDIDVNYTIEKIPYSTFSRYKSVVMVGTEQMKARKVAVRKDSKRMFDDLFNKMDGDGGGGLDRKELRKMFERYDLKLSDDQMTDVMKKMDADGDGEVDPGEFMAFFSSGMGKLQELIKKKMMQDMTMKELGDMWKNEMPDADIGEHKRSKAVKHMAVARKLFTRITTSRAQEADDSPYTGPEV